MRKEFQDITGQEPIQVTPQEILAQKGIYFGIYPHILRDTSRIEPYRGQIEKVAYDSILQASYEMPIRDVSIGVFDFPENCIPELGIGGAANGKVGAYKQTLIEIDLDPESQHRDSAISKELARTIRHELHHDVRGKFFGQDKNLRDRVILEGLAQHYEIEGTDEKPPIYATALMPDQLQPLLKLIEADFESFGEKASDWLFGAEDKGIPRWTGYSIGYHIIGEYLKSHPDQKASSLYAAPSEIFFK